jgi:hypothetical protein
VVAEMDVARTRTTAPKTGCAASVTAPVIVFSVAARSQVKVAGSTVEASAQNSQRLRMASTSRTQRMRTITGAPASF